MERRKTVAEQVGPTPKGPVRLICPPPLGTVASQERWWPLTLLLALTMVCTQRDWSQTSLGLSPLLTPGRDWGSPDQRWAGRWG